MALEIITTTLLYLACQGHSFRGHHEGDGSFMQLLQLRSADCVELASWLNGSQRNKWTAHDIQNEILQILSHAVIREIVQKCVESRFFSINADESTDVSGQQQLSVILRHVDEDFSVHEDFVGLYEVDKADAANLSAIILDCLRRFGLDVHMLRGQGYDGAAVMSGSRNGVATKIAEVEHRAVYMHCAGHTLNLA